jgi:predicted MFS family arabinose efflux permease
VKHPALNLPAALASIVGLRTAINAAFRAPLPFLAAIAASFNADPSSVAWLGLSFSLAGLVAPFAGMVENALGRRGAVMLSIGLFSAMCFALPFAPTLPVAAVMFVLIGVAKALFEPQSLAFISENVPVERRGAAVGIVELAWALAWIIGTPMFGFFIDFGRWWMTFIVTGVAALVFAALVLRYAGMGTNRPPTTAGFSLAGVTRIVTYLPALRMLLYGVLISFPAQLTTLIYGPYMQQLFTLTPTMLGIVSITIGVADLLAELATVAFVDRLGQRRSLLIGTAAYAVSLLFFWLVAGNLVLMLVGLFLIFFTFEFALVTSLAVQSEVVPDARATMAGFVAGTHSVSRILASLLALPLFVGGTLALPMMLGALLVTLAVWVGWTQTYAPSAAASAGSGHSHDQ